MGVDEATLMVQVVVMVVRQGFELEILSGSKILLRVSRDSHQYCTV